MEEFFAQGYELKYVYQNFGRYISVHARKSSPDGGVGKGGGMFFKASDMDDKVWELGDGSIVSKIEEGRLWSVPPQISGDEIIPRGFVLYPTPETSVLMGGGNFRWTFQGCRIWGFDVNPTPRELRENGRVFVERAVMPLPQGPYQTEGLLMAQPQIAKLVAMECKDLSGDLLDWVTKDVCREKMDWEDEEMLYEQCEKAEQIIFSVYSEKCSISQETKGVLIPLARMWRATTAHWHTGNDYHEYAAGTIEASMAAKMVTLSRLHEIIEESLVTQKLASH